MPTLKLRLLFLLLPLLLLLLLLLLTSSCTDAHRLGPRQMGNPVKLGNPPSVDLTRVGNGTLEREKKTTTKNSPNSATDALGRRRDR